MYINLKYLAEIELSLEHVFVLQMAKQQRNEDATAVLEGFTKHIHYLGGLDLLRTIKGDKNDSELRKLRLSKKGDEILSNVETPELLEEDLKIFNWLKETYLKKEKKVGNMKKTKMLIANFRVHSGISRNALAKLAGTFVQDDANMEFSHVLEYVFWKAPSAYATRFQLEDSRLYKYYLRNQEYFDNLFKTL